jgi:hypothetical protein
MADGENRPTVLAAVIVGLCLLAGLTAAGYFIGRGRRASNLTCAL